MTKRNNRRMKNGRQEISQVIEDIYSDHGCSDQHFGQFFLLLPKLMIERYPFSALFFPSFQTESSKGENSWGLLRAL